jgi:hypothetical protein
MQTAFSFRVHTQFEPGQSLNQKQTHKLALISKSAVSINPAIITQSICSILGEKKHQKQEFKEG